MFFFFMRGQIKLLGHLAVNLVNWSISETGKLISKISEAKHIKLLHF